MSTRRAFTLVAAGVVVMLALVSVGRATVTGVWRGPARHAGTDSDVALSIEAADTALAVRLSLPAIDVWDMPVGRASLDGDTLRIGWWNIHYDRARDVLDGILPGALVPIFQIPFTLHRVDSLARPAPQAQSAPAPQPLWVLDTGAPVWAGVAAWDGRVYAGNDAGVLTVARAGSGDPLWRFQCGGPIRARPALHGGAVFVHSDDGYLYRIDAESGKETWRVQLLETARVRIPPGQRGSRYDHYAASATVDGARIFVGAGDGSIHALDLDTGETLWRFQCADAVASTPAVAGGCIIAGSFDGHVYALDAGTGEEVWRHDTGAPVVSEAAIWRGRVIVGSRSYELLALDAATGTPAWTFYMWFSWVESPATVRDGVAYVGSSDAQRLFAIDASGGKALWSVDTGGSAWTQPAVDGGAVYIGSVGVSDYMVDHRGGFVAVERTGGQLRWLYPVERPGEAKLWGFASSPAVEGGRVFVGDLDGRLFAFPSDMER